MAALLPLLLLLAAAEPPDDPPAPPPIDQLKSVVVKAIRNCGISHGDEITVCSRDRGIAEGYRLPKISPRLADAAHPHGKVDALTAGAAGQGSCSATGAAGSTGCSLDQARAWAEWKKLHKADGAPFPW